MTTLKLRMTEAHALRDLLLRVARPRHEDEKREVERWVRLLTGPKS